MKTYLTESGLLVTDMNWKEYQETRKAREITPEPQTLNLSLKQLRAKSVLQIDITNVTDKY